MIAGPGSVTCWEELEVYREVRFMVKKSEVGSAPCLLVNGSAIGKHYIWKQFRPIALVSIRHFSSNVQKCMVFPSNNCVGLWVENGCACFIYMEQFAYTCEKFSFKNTSLVGFKAFELAEAGDLMIHEGFCCCWS